MTAIMSAEQWSDLVGGYKVISAAIGFDNTRYCFLLQQDTDDWDTPPQIRMLFARMERPQENRFFWGNFNNIDLPELGSANTGEDEFVVADMHGKVIVYSNSLRSVELEKPGIDTRWLEGERRAPVRRLKRVNGRLYAVCQDRRLLLREEASNWLEFPGLERPKERLDPKVLNLDFGFADMDAFGESDVYAVGGTGDVWHYDGKKWRRCDFPSNEWLFTVCCAGDGNVYITGNMGSLWVGRGDKWKQLSTGTYSVSFNDSVWFAGKLWCVNDYALYTLGKRGLSTEGVPPFTQLTTRRLNVSADGSQMISAGNHGASLHDGKEWRVLFSGIEIV